MAKIALYGHLIGAEEITMYILSVHNLKNRSPEELSNLLNAFRHILDYTFERRFTQMYVFLADILQSKLKLILVRHTT